MLIICLDLGGSGIKIGILDKNKMIFLKKIEQDMNKSWNEQIMLYYKLEEDCVKYIKDHLPSSTYKYIGISTAGTINGDYIQRWGQKYKILKKLRNLSYIVYAMNDGEAHLWSTIHDKSDGPYMGICLGTGVGFAISSENGLIQRFQSERNIELSDIPIFYDGILDIHKFCSYDNFIESKRN